MDLIAQYESDSESDNESMQPEPDIPQRVRPVSKRTRAPNKRKRNQSNWMNPFDSMIAKSKFPCLSPYTRYVVGRFLNNDNVPSTIWDFLPPEHATREECETNPDYRSFRDQINYINYTVKSKSLIGIEPHEGCIQKGRHVICSSGITKEKSYWIDHKLVTELWGECLAP